MYQNQTIGKPHFGPEYVPYFYASGRFVADDLPQAVDLILARMGEAKDSRP